MIDAADEGVGTRVLRSARRGRTTAVLRGMVAALPLLFGQPQGSAAAGRRLAAVPCTPDGGEMVRIDHVDDDLGLTLADGRTVVLAGIDPVRATAQHPDLATEARAKLDSWLRGRDATLRAVMPSLDRWGRVPALVFAATGRAETAGAGPPLSVALAMVDAGLARARPEPETRGCWPTLLSAETAARASGLGLWADPHYAVRDAADDAAVATAVGGLALVEGPVIRVGHGRTRLFVGLGRKGSGFEVRIAKRNSTILTELGLEEAQLVGTRLRARGFLDDRFGPSIDITSPDQIEILPAGDTTVSDPATGR